jgi:hypothetical protein
MTRPPGAQLVDMRGDELLTGTGLTQQQHRRIGGGHLSGLFQHAPNSLALPDDHAGIGALLSLSTQVRALHPQPIARVLDLQDRLAQRFVAFGARQDHGEDSSHDVHGVERLSGPVAFAAQHVDAECADDPPGDGDRDSHRRADAARLVAFAVHRVRDLVAA